MKARLQFFSEKGKKRQKWEKTHKNRYKIENFSIFEKGTLMLATIGTHEKTKICCVLFKYLRNI